ncbi:MAG: hypothetical protein ACOX47_14855 [Bacillota bacterium]|jgi:hypothetical protein
MLDHLRHDFRLRVLDLNKDNIGEKKCGITIEDRDMPLYEVISWADLILATGSMVTNGTILNFINLKKPVFFYGTTIAGPAYLMGLHRLCFSAS